MRQASSDGLTFHAPVINCVAQYFMQSHRRFEKTSCYFPRRRQQVTETVLVPSCQAIHISLLSSTPNHFVGNHTTVPRKGILSQNRFNRRVVTLAKVNQHLLRGINHLIPILEATLVSYSNMSIKWKYFDTDLYLFFPCQVLRKSFRFIANETQFESILLFPRPPETEKHELRLASRVIPCK
jgi:hypothetical protein